VKGKESELEARLLKTKMGDEGKAGGLEQIVDQESHDAIVNKSNQAANVPLIIVYLEHPGIKVAAVIYN